MKQLPIARLHELFKLDESTGQLFWKVRLGTRITIGDEAGTVGQLGYRMIQIDRKLYAAHRIIFAMVHGRWPADMIDHINMVRSDNRPGNLREANRAGNTHNRGIQANNTSGVKCVSWCKSMEKWQAYITVDKKRIHLGFHEDIDSAKNSVDAARAKYHGEFARAA